MPTRAEFIQKRRQAKAWHGDSVYDAHIVEVFSNSDEDGVLK